MNVTLLIGEPTQTFALVTRTGSCVNTMQLLQLACGGCACCSCAYFSCIILGNRKSLRAGRWTDNWLCVSAYIQSNKTPAGKKKKNSILSDPVALRACMSEYARCVWAKSSRYSSCDSCCSPTAGVQRGPSQSFTQLFRSFR